MKKTLVVIIVGLIITGTVITLKQSKPIDKNLLVADKLMPDRPDSALRVLERLNANNFRGENKALYALLMTQAQFKNYKPVNSDTLIRIAYDYYIPGNDSLRKAQTYFYQARIDENMGRKEDAINNFHKAIKAALQTNDYNLLALMYNRCGMLFQKQSLYENALDFLYKSLGYSKLNKDTVMQMFTFKEIATVYSLKGKYSQALYNYDQALCRAEKIKDSICIYHIYNSLSNLCRCKGESELAIHFANRSISINPDSPLNASNYLLKGIIYAAKNQLDSARYYINRGRRADDLASNATYYFYLSKLERNIGNFEKAVIYLNKYVAYADCFENQSRRSEIAELQKKYDYTLIKNENNELKISRQRVQIIALAISLIALVSIILSLYYFYRKRSVKRAMKLELDKMQHNLMNEKLNYYKEKTIEAQRNLIKEQELGRELSLKTEALKIHQEREKELKEHIFQMETVVKKIDAFNSMKPLQRIKSESQFTLTYQELSNLEEAMNLCHEQFAARLRANYPKLKDNDVHLCCLLKLKVPGKNIMGLLNLSELTLKKRKYRIKHEKMEMPVSVTSLDDFLCSF